MGGGVGVGVGANKVCLSVLGMRLILLDETDVILKMCFGQPS